MAATKRTTGARVILALLMGALAGTSPSGAEITDRIVAVVGDEIILLSEVDEEVYLASLREGTDISDPSVVEEYRTRILEAMIEEKILLDQARQEGIRVTREEIDRGTQTMLQQIRDRFPDESTFQTQLAAEGMTVADLERTYRDKVEEQLIVQQAMDRLVKAEVIVDELEIQNYWELHQDEIPAMPAQLELRHIYVKLSTEAVIDSAAVERAEIVLERIRSGEDFATLASVFSEGPAAARGGELGWFAPTDLGDALQDAIQDLSTGEVTDVVTTDRGAHILKVEETRDDGDLRLRQIVFLRDEDAARTSAQARAEAILRRLRAGEDFSAVARDESDDPATAAKGGYIGKVPIESLDASIRPALERLSPGDISDVVSDAEGFAVYRIDGKEGERPATYDEVRDRIALVLEQQKSQELYKRFLEKVRHETFIENRLATES